MEKVTVEEKMEEQRIITSTRPRVTLKKLSGSKYAWEISLSDGENLTEIIEEIEKANNLMKDKFKSKEKKEE